MKKKSKKQKEKDKEAEKEREREMLKLTLDIVVKENVQLKKMLEEMKVNVTENKMQLQEKINSITDKDTAVAMLSTQIDLLKQKFNDLQSRQKMMSFVNSGTEETSNLKNTEATIISSPFLKRKKNTLKTEEQNKYSEDYIRYQKVIKENINKQKMFLQTQQDIQNSIMDIKREVLYLKEKINEHKGNKIFYQKNLNIQNVLKEEDIIKIKNFIDNQKNKINSSDSKSNNLIYLITDDNRVFKIKKREDLSKNDFINKIEMDYYNNFNEIIDLRESSSNNNNDEENIGEISINNYVEQIQNDIISKSNRDNPNSSISDSSYENDLDNDEAGVEQNENRQDSCANSASRNKQKSKNINSYVSDLMKGSFVL